MKPIARIADKAGVLGTLVSAMGCAMYFPALASLGAAWLRGTPWMRPLVYTGIALMAVVSVWDLVSPANRRCGPDSCELPAKNG
ncbi:hypothetical protein AB4090_14460 [Acidithiobacillus sp. IBUN Pt1247-S3]|uniref:hypothetical protein n=1 Tax=Acidithiobacillus sp. IBUN Pt1247-S3 TaxID=3166642 RepID=UPI0034E47D78